MIHKVRNLRSLKVRNLKNLKVRGKLKDTQSPQLKEL